ncbi:MAG: insulinase family protein, partial [Deltaproteobacteria bacterium]|nr:insulinase family protein [Deltaproteobacteria bacterium]
VSFYAAFPGGLRFENARTNGLSGFMASMLTRGTQKRSREDIARDVEDMAGSVSGFSGWNTVGVSGSFLSDFFDRGLEIFADVALNPAFPDAEVEKLRKETIAAINRQEDYLPAYTFKLLYRDLYKDHPYGMPTTGTLETVNAFSRDDVIRRYEEFFAPDRMVLAIAGDVDADQAIERVTALFKGLKRPPSKLPAPPVEKRQTAIRSTGAVKDKAQTNIGIGFLGAAINSEDRYALKVLSEVLSGQSGRLFLDLRDKQSLAYALSAFSKEAADPGVFAVYIACAPEKKDAAIEGILKELKDISNEKVSPEELKRARNSIIGGYEIGLQQVSSQAADMANNELFGFGYDFSRTYPKKIEAVSASDVLQAARRYITLNAYTISIVGPAAKTDVKKTIEEKDQKGVKEPKEVKGDKDGAEKK